MGDRLNNDFQFVQVNRHDPETKDMHSRTKGEKKVKKK